MHTAIVKLDALADAVRAAAEHHDLVAVSRFGLAFFFIGRIQVGSAGSELGGAGIHPLVYRMHAELFAQAAHAGFARADQTGQAAVGKALALEEIQPFAIVQRRQAQGAHLAGDLHQFLDLHQEPRVDAGQVVKMLDRVAEPECLRDEPQPPRPGHAQGLLEHGMRVRVAAVEDFVKAIGADFQAAQGFLQRFLEGAANGHHLTDRFHLGGQTRIGLGEFLEIEARHLGDHIVDAWLEGGRRAPTGDFVFQFVEGVANRQLGGNLGNREARGLGG